jgi:CRISPR-associated endoribonuclease Cas6
MELSLKLALLRGNSLPLNYSYAVSSWIYSIIGCADKEYSQFLHNQGFRADGRSFKMFTFSQLDLRPYKISGNRITLLGKEIALTIRFLVDSSLEHFVKGLFMEQRLTLGDRQSTITFEVSAVETAPPVYFLPHMQYRCLAPICMGRLRHDGSAEYVHPADPQFGELLVNNLVRKARALQLERDEWQQTPLSQFNLLNTPRKKGIHIKEGTTAHTQVISYLFHFELTAPPELHEIGYYAGFGEKNSMGFGCVDIVKDKN